MKKVVILHGWTYSIDKWQSLLKLLKGSGISLDILNIPGLTSEDNNVWDLDKYVEWLHKEIVKTDGKVILIGHSNGGRIAIAYTVKYPRDIERLILIDSAGIYHNELPIRIKRLAFGLFTKIGKKFTQSSFLRKALYKLARESDYEKASENMKKTMVNLLKVDIKPYLEKIDVHTEIIWGKLDKITPLSDAYVMKALIKNSRLNIIDKARHSPFYSNPIEVSRIIKNDL